MFNGFYIEEKKLKFGRGKDTGIISGIRKYGPYDIEKRKFRTIKVVIGIPEQLNKKLIIEKAREYYKILINGTRKIEGLKSLFKVKCKSSDNVQIIGLPTEEKIKADIMLCIVPTEEDHPNTFSEIKQSLLSVDMPSQMLKIKRLFEIEKRRDLVGEIANLAIGIYVKTGGMPWVLSEPIKGIDYFIGYDIALSKKEDYTIASFHVFNSHGIWLGYHTYRTSFGEKNECLKTTLEKISNLLKNAKTIVFHRDGEIKQWETNLIKENISCEYVLLSVKKTGVPRLYNLSREDYMPERGYYVKLSDKWSVLCTTGIPKYPYGTPRNLGLEISEISSKMSIETISEQVFWMTKLNWRSKFKYVRLPVTTSYADNTTAHGISGVFAPEGSKVYRTPWFI